VTKKDPEEQSAQLGVSVIGGDGSFTSRWVAVRKQTHPDEPATPAEKLHTGGTNSYFTLSPNRAAAAMRR
jgi:hypothetical protein